MRCSLLCAFGALCLPLFAHGAEGDFLSGVRQLTFEGKRAGEGYFGADGRELIFQSEREADNPFYQIYLMDLETGDVERMSPGYGKTTCAWIHPSGRRVMYASTHDDPDARRKMRDEIEFRASGQERRYSWDYDEHFELYAYERATGERTRLTNARGYDAEGSYSPDGSKIAFASNRKAYSEPMSDADAAIFEHDKAHMMDIYIMDADGSNVRQLTDVPGYDGGPFFSPDGSAITWRRFSTDGSVAEIYKMDLATGKETQLTRTGVMSWAPYFHPSGEYLIYASNREGFNNFELFLVDAAGRSAPVRVTTTEGFDGLPVFSPDGSQLAWTSNRTASNQSQIFLGNWNHAGALAALDASMHATSAAISAEDARSHVERLTAEDMEGRLTGTPGETRATEYVARVFENLGLQPGGDDGTYFQEFSFTAGASLSGDNSLALGGDAATLEVDWRPLSLSMNGELEAAVVFAGYGIVAPEGDGQPAYDSYGDLDITDKWVMVLRYQPEELTPERRRHLVRYSNIAYKASWAKRKGAAGLIVVSGPNAEVNSELVPLRMDATTATTSIAAVSVTNKLAQSILDAAERDLGELQDALDEGDATVAFEIPDVEVAATLEIVREQRMGRNVIGTLAAGGSTAAPVIIGAHVDHLGYGQVSGSLAKENEKGQIHPGADDNASGVAGLLETAEYLVDLKARGKLDAVRDVHFVAWSGEELGTLGSQHFVDELAGEGTLEGQVAAYLNLDMIGRVGDKAYLQGTGSSSVWAREIERRNVPVGLPVTTSSDPYLPTDSTPFYMKKVPVLAAFSGVHEEYSTPRDTIELINFDGIRDVTRLMAGITRSLALNAEDPDYVEAERTRRVGRSSMRVYLGTIPGYGEEEGTVGVKLQGAVKGSPAAAAGIQENDVLVGLAGEEIETIYDFMSIMGGLKAGEATDVTVLRNGSRVTLEIVPGARD